MTYPATTYAEGVELTITSGNQLHEIINGSATEEVDTESGMVPSVRKALADSMLFKPAIAWAEGSVESDPFQTRLYGEGIYWAPAASNETPISMGSNPTTDSNWFLSPVTGGESISRNTNLLSNHNFVIKSPDNITHPSVTPTDYVAGTQVFSGVFVGVDIVGLTYIDGRVSWTSGTLYFSVPNTGALEYVDQTDFVASVADFDGKPRTRGVSFALVGGEYRVTVSIDALKDESANETLLGSVKFEQGSVATGHEAYRSSEQPIFDSVFQAKSAQGVSVHSTVKTQSYYAGWAALNAGPSGGAEYIKITLAEARDVKGDPAWVPDDYGDHLCDDGDVLLLPVGQKILAPQFGVVTNFDCTANLQEIMNRVGGFEPREHIDLNARLVVEFGNQEALISDTVLLDRAQGVKFVNGKIRSDMNKPQLIIRDSLWVFIDDLFLRGSDTFTWTTIPIGEEFTRVGIKLENSYLLYFENLKTWSFGTGVLQEQGNNVQADTFNCRYCINGWHGGSGGNNVGNSFVDAALELCRTGVNLNNTSSFFFGNNSFRGGYTEGCTEAIRTFGPVQLSITGVYFGLGAGESALACYQPVGDDAATQFRFSATIDDCEFQNNAVTTDVHAIKAESKLNVRYSGLKQSYVDGQTGSILIEGSAVKSSEGQFDENIIVDSSFQDYVDTDITSPATYAWGKNSTSVTPVLSQDYNLSKTGQKVLITTADGSFSIGIVQELQTIDEYSDLEISSQTELGSVISIQDIDAGFSTIASFTNTDATGTVNDTKIRRFFLGEGQRNFRVLLSSNAGGTAGYSNVKIRVKSGVFPKGFKRPSLEVDESTNI